MVQLLARSKSRASHRKDLLEEAVELLWHYGKRVLSSRVAVAAVSAVAVTGMAP